MQKACNFTLHRTLLGGSPSRADVTPHFRFSGASVRMDVTTSSPMDLRSLLQMMMRTVQQLHLNAGANETDLSTHSLQPRSLNVLLDTSSARTAQRSQPNRYRRRPRSLLPHFNQLTLPSFMTMDPSIHFLSNYALCFPMSEKARKVFFYCCCSSQSGAVLIDWHWFLLLLCYQSVGQSSERASEATARLRWTACTNCV